MIGVTTASSTVKEAAELGAQISEEHRKRFDAGDKESILDLLSICPEFVLEGWVKEGLDELERIGFFRKKRRRGRPRGMTHVSRAVRTAIVALVEYRTSSLGVSKAQAIEDLADRGFENLSFETLRRYYFETRRDARFRPILVADESQKRLVTCNELREAFQNDSRR